MSKKRFKKRDIKIMAEYIEVLEASLMFIYKNPKLSVKDREAVIRAAVISYD